MRRQREVKPPRRPRIVSARLVAVALVVGVVLAVVSVPVCAVGWEVRGLRLREADLLACRHADGHTMLVARYDLLGLTVWDVMSQPDADGSTLRSYMEEPRMRRVERDVWPAGLRTPLDGQIQGRSSHRYGWPLRAAERTHRWDPAASTTVRAGDWSLRAFGHDLTLPTLPLWPGLLGNAAFFGVLVMTPAALVRWATLRRRARRGLCLACAYRLGEDVRTCPECGLARAGAANA